MSTNVTSAELSEVSIPVINSMQNRIKTYIAEFHLEDFWNEHWKILFIATTLALW